MNTKVILFAVLLLVCLVMGAAAMRLLPDRQLLTSEAPSGSGLNLRVIESGHSLTDPIPSLLREMAIAAGADPDVVIDRSTMPGSTMEQRWNQIPGDDMPDARAAIALYDLLVLTERVPLSNTMPHHDTVADTLRWVEHARMYGSGGRGARTLLYATWVGLDSGPGYENPSSDPEGHIRWRDRLPLEFARWLEVANSVNNRLPADAEPMRVIPATLVLAAASDDIAAGKAAGLDDIKALFSDDIHLSEAGAYLVALTQFATIYGLDPRGLPDQSLVSPAVAAWMQALVRDVVGAYSTAEQRHLDGTLTLADFQQCLWGDVRNDRGCLERTSRMPV